MAQEKNEGIFRCPFEQRGEREGTIITVCLGETNSGRMRQMAAAFETFYGDVRYIALRFIVPSFRYTGQPFADLQKEILPYQCEILGAELDFRLRPFLPYYDFKSAINNAAGKDFSRIAEAYALTTAINGGRKQNAVLSASDISDWLHRVIGSGISNGTPNPTLLIRNLLHESPQVIIHTTPGGVVLGSDREENICDPQKNQNIFNIVKGPFYPETFGRYSPVVEIVCSREAHFAALPKDLRIATRTVSNRILSAGGVRIKNVKEDKQPTGLWTPEFVTL